MDQKSAPTSGVGGGIDNDATAIGVDPHGSVAVDGGGGGERGGCGGGGTAIDATTGTASGAERGVGGETTTMGGGEAGVVGGHGGDSRQDGGGGAGVGGGTGEVAHATCARAGTIVGAHEGTHVRDLDNVVVGVVGRTIGGASGGHLEGYWRLLAATGGYLRQLDAIPSLIALVLSVSFVLSVLSVSPSLVYGAFLISLILVPS